MSLNKNYRKDVNAAWLRVSPDIELLCAYVDARSPQWQSKLSEKTRAVRKLIEHNALPPDEDRKYAVETFVELCLQGWRTVLTAADGTITYRDEIEANDGEWLTYSPENARALFARYPKFYLDTVDLAQDLKAFQVTETALKN